MTDSANLLPKGFESLLPFVDRWAVPTTAERMALREQSSMDDILDFYHAILPRAEEAMNLIEQHPLHELPEDMARLCQLLLGLCHAAIAVEVHGQPRLPDTPYLHGISLVKSTAPFG